MFWTTINVDRTHLIRQAIWQIRVCTHQLLKEHALYNQEVFLSLLSCSRLLLAALQIHKYGHHDSKQPQKGLKLRINSKTLVLCACLRLIVPEDCFSISYGNLTLLSFTAFFQRFLHDFLQLSVLCIALFMLLYALFVSQKQPICRLEQQVANDPG